MAVSAVFSVIFPGNLPYFQHFLESLVQQRERDFELFLLCDKVPSVEDYLHEFRSKISIVVHHLNGSIASIREQGLEMIAQGTYQFIIFADTDDTLGPERIEKAILALTKAPVVAADPVLIDHQGRIMQNELWGKRIMHNALFDRSFIERSNIVGLGNAAVRREILRPVKLPDDLIAVDWYLFYHLLDDRQGVFIHHSGCYYRQHQTNTVGASKVSAQKIRQIINTKCIHYKHLSETNARFLPLLQRHERLAKRVAIDEGFLRASVESLSNQSIPYFWWEETEYIHE